MVLEMTNGNHGGEASSSASGEGGRSGKKVSHLKREIVDRVSFSE